MDRCVKRVQTQGHDKPSAIAICHTSIVGRKERRAKRLERQAINTAILKAESYGGTPRADLKASDFVLSDERKFPVMTAQDVRDAVSSWGRYKGPTSFESFKQRLAALAKRKGFSSALPATWKAKELEAFKANYGAKVGETIQGALGRGAGGRFTRAGGAPASGRETVNALTARAKKPKGGKKKLGDAEQDKIGEQAGIDSEDFAALRSLSKAGNVSDGDTQRLVNLGLAERGTDGSLRMASNARGLLRAARSGDVQGAKDALSKARDRASAARDRDAKRSAAAAKPSKGGGGGKTSDAEAKRAQREAQRASERQSSEVRKVTDRIEEMDALIGSDAKVTPAERAKRGNQLDELERRLTEAGGDKKLADKIDELRKKLAGDEGEDSPSQNARPAPAPPRRVVKEAGPAIGSFAVFKQGDTWRWLGASSNAYRDRDGEIVSTKALEDDTQRADDLGPLRFWHMGEVRYGQPLDWTTSYAGSGIDIGAVDFRAMDGRMLIESGTFKQGAPVEAIASNPNGWQMSVGFTHPLGEPDQEGVYNRVRIFERSLLPKGAAANPFTAFAVSREGDSMASLQDKWKEFVALFNGDESKAKAFAAQNTEAQKEIESNGVAFKEGEAAAVAEAPAEAKADEPAAEAVAEADGAASFLDELTVDEFKAVIADALAPLIQGMTEVVTGAAAKDISAVAETADATAKELADLKQAKVKEADESKARITALDVRIAELEGDAPTGKTKGYRASQDAATVTQKQVTQPQREGEIASLTSWLIGSNDGA